jgi:hypothetical protein
MAVHLKADFAKLCGLTTGNLTVYIGRKKVVMSGDVIDDTIPLNKEFLEHRIALQSQKSPQPEPAPKKLRLIKPDPGTPDIQPKVKQPDNIDELSDEEFEEMLNGSDDLDSLFKATKSLDHKKTIVEIKKKQKEIAILTIREEKARGLVIPTDLVLTLINQHSRTIAAEFKNSVDSILTKISKKKDLSAVEQSDLRGELLHVINQTVDKTVNVSQKNVGNIVKEFIEKRDVGERS